MVWKVEHDKQNKPCCFINKYVKTYANFCS
jgi:hypothetical protein